MKQVSIFKYIHNSQAMLRWSISLVLALAVSLGFASLTLLDTINANKKILNALSPYLMTQVEVNDRTEITRILHSVTKNDDSKLVLVKSGDVLSTTGDIQELDLPFKKPEIKFELFDGIFTNDMIIVANTLKRNSSSSESKVYFYSPLLPIMKNALWFMSLCFALSMAISLFVSWRTKKALKRALRPLEQLHEEIRNLTNESNDTRPIKIKELEDIRQTISSTRAELAATNEKLAVQKAKELTSNSYRRLIHDLHNPVTALKQMVRLHVSPDTDETTKKEVLEYIPRIAEEILQQANAAKKNLEHYPDDFQEVDLRNCLRESFYQVRSSFEKDKDKIKLNLPDTPVIFRHDPSMLKRAIVNLLENGLEASKEKVELTLDANENYTSIKVIDDGPGLDSDKVSLYLQGRGQSSKANRQAFGLSSTNHIARSHGGKIIYQKNNFGGSSFEIRLEAQ